MLHGGPGGTMNNGEEMAPLAKGRTVIFYDQRGGGRSELVSDPTLLTANHHVRDLEALREHFRLEHMSLLGISWGSGLVALYTAEHPQRVARLLLVSPMPVARLPFGPERREKIEAVLGKEKIARRDEVARRIPTASDDDAVALCREQLSIGMSAYLLDQRHLAHLVDRCNEMSPASIRNRPTASRATTASLGDWDFRPILARLTMPALVFEGARTNVPLSSTREWASVLPNARLLLIPDAATSSGRRSPTSSSPPLITSSAASFQRTRKSSARRRPESRPGPDRTERPHPRGGPWLDLGKQLQPVQRLGGEDAVGDDRFAVVGEHFDHRSIEQDPQRDRAVAPGDGAGVAARDTPRGTSFAATCAGRRTLPGECGRCPRSLPRRRCSTDGSPVSLQSPGLTSRRISADGGSEALPEMALGCGVVRRASSSATGACTRRSPSGATAERRACVGPTARLATSRSARRWYTASCSIHAIQMRRPSLAGHVRERERGVEVLAVVRPSRPFGRMVGDESAAVERADEVLPARSRRRCLRG